MTSERKRVRTEFFVKMKQLTKIDRNAGIKDIVNERAQMEKISLVNPVTSQNERKIYLFNNHVYDRVGE